MIDAFVFGGFFYTGAQMRCYVGRLVGHQRAEATGVDLTLTLCYVDRGRVCMPSCFMNEENLCACVCASVCEYTRGCVFQAGSASRG